MSCQNDSGSASGWKHPKMIQRPQLAPLQLTSPSQVVHEVRGIPALSAGALVKVSLCKTKNLENFWETAWLSSTRGFGYCTRSGVFVACKIWTTALYAFPPFNQLSLISSTKWSWYFWRWISSEGAEHTALSANFLFFTLLHCSFFTLIFSSQQLYFNFLSVCFLSQLTAISTLITLARLQCWWRLETRVCLTNGWTSRRVVCVKFKWDEYSRMTHSLLFHLYSYDFISDSEHLTRQTPPTTGGIFFICTLLRSFFLFSSPVPLV